MNRPILLAITASVAAHGLVIAAASWLPVIERRRVAEAIAFDLVEREAPVAVEEEPVVSAAPAARPVVRRVAVGPKESPAPVPAPAPPPELLSPADPVIPVITAEAVLPAGVGGIPVNVMVSGSHTGSEGSFGGTGRGSSSATVGSTSGNGGGTGAGSAHGAILAGLRARTAGCYPRAAVRRSVEGVARVSFCVDRDGDPEGLRLVASSGSRLLDEAALVCVVRGAAPLPGAGACVQVPIDFHLRR